MKFYFAVIPFIALIGSPVFAQEECTELESDIARLDCFDQAFSASGQSVNASPLEAFEEFSELVSSEHVYGDNGIHLIGASFLEDTCEVAILSLSNALARPKRNAGISMIFFDAADVEALNQAGDRGVEVVMQRGATISSYNGSYTESGGRPAFRKTHNELLETFEADRLSSQFLANFERVFSYGVNITTRQSQVDRERIVNSLEDLITSCDAAD